MKYALSDIVDWLAERPHGWEYVSLILMSLFAMFMASIVSTMLLVAMSAPMVSYTQVTEVPAGEIGVNCIKIMSLGFWGFLATAAMFEELLFRLLPLMITALITAVVVYLVNDYTGRDIDIRRAVIVMAMIVAVPCSMYFGYGHGNIFNVLIQGMGGFILSVVYIKCGGVSEGFLKGFVSSSALHFIFNGILFLNAVHSGMAYFSFIV